MTSTSSRPVVRLSSPGDIVASIPTLCGFPPHDSVVLLSLRGPRRRLGLTVRLDLPPRPVEQEAAQLLVARLVQDAAAAAVAVVYGSERRAELVEAIVYACRAHGIAVAEGLHVDDDRWTSYLCTASCCPPKGTPVPPVPGLVEAQSALEGRAVLASRDELVRSLAPPQLLQAALSGQALDTATVKWVAACEREGVEPARAAALRQARAALDEVADGGCVGLDVAARVAVVLHDVRVRDEVATWSLKRSDALLSLTEQVVRLVVPPYDAPVCTLLAWVSYARGDGSRANVALDRALRTDPAYSLALLLRQSLDAALPPAVVRRTLRDTRRALRS